MWIDDRSGPSPHQGFMELPVVERDLRIADLSPVELEALNYHWPFWARPNQLLPAGAWTIWLVLAGRGFGKSRLGSEAVREWVRTNEYVNLIGATADDARDIMIEGDSGIMACCPKAERPHFVKHERKLKWPNGATSLIFTADAPERLRGKQHMKLWMDEAAAWRYQEAYDQAVMGLRLGSTPQAVITTTPKPLPWIVELAKTKGTIVTKGKTLDNTSNLAPTFISTLIKKYEGTRLGRQELDAEILDDAPGALWKRAYLDSPRVAVCPPLVRTVVAIDPAVTATEDSDETGIIVVGIGHDGHGYVLEDASGKYTVSEWSSLANTLYKKHSCEAVVVEVNQGGDLVKSVLFNVNALLPVKEVRASKGKVARAEPVALVYEQGRVHHVGVLGTLEDQLCSFDPTVVKKSPDRLDALVWGFTHLMVNEPADGTGLIEQEGWRPWAAAPPRCDDVVLSACVWEEGSDRLRFAIAAWGIFTAPQDDGTLSAIMLECRQVHGYVSDISSAAFAMTEAHGVNRILMDSDPGVTRFIGKHLRRVCDVHVRQMPYDHLTGPQMAGALVKDGRVFYPSGKLWAQRAILDLKRYPHGDTDALAHAVGVGLTYLRHHGRLRVLNEPEAQPELPFNGVYG